MSPEYQEYYQQLQSAFQSHELMNSSEESNRTEMERVEACFKSSLDYWGKVCKLVKRNGFVSEAAEIHFFREVKPAFTAFIEYYTYRYHSLLFVPAGDPAEVNRFWKWEEKKIERFFESNRDFIRYIEEGDRSRDRDYFLRAALPKGRDRRGGSLAHELDEELISPKDQLVTLLKAYILYAEYIRNFIYINQSNLPP